MRIKKGETKYPQLKDKEWMKEQYSKKGMTIQKIAEKIGCSCTTVQHWLAFLKIQRRLNYVGLNKIRNRPKGENSPLWKGGKEKKICPICNKEFERYFHKKHPNIYCSDKCARIGSRKRIEMICQYCGNKYEIPLCRKGKSKYCSFQCYLKGRKMPTHHTKPELIFEEICKNNNLGFHYVGDGSLWIGKKGEKQLNPDFIEANGKKICIEVMGDYWHSPLLNKNLREDALLSYRKKHYKKYKWDSIFIWESDLKREDAEQFVLNKLGELK